MNFNRKMIFAFLLIFLTFLFFNSKIYTNLYEKVFKRKPGLALQPPAPQKAVENGSVSQNMQTNKAEPALEASKSALVSPIVAVAESSTVVWDTVWIETEKFICGINELGARIISFKTKEYKQKNEDIELLHYSSEGGANLSINDRSFDQNIFRSKQGSETVVLKQDSVSLSFMFLDAEFGEIIKTFTFYKNTYTIGVSVHSAQLPGSKVTMGWLGGINESEQKSTASTNPVSFQRTVHTFYGNTAEHITEKKETTKEETGNYRWVGLTSKYFLIALLPDSIKNADLQIHSRIIHDSLSVNQKNVQYDYSFSMARTSEQTVDSYRIYIGPAKIQNLKITGAELQKVLYWGDKFWSFLFVEFWFPQLCELLLEALIFFQQWFNDYGLVIIVLTIILKIITFPLAHSSMKSMARMNDVKPKMDALRTKYKNKPAELNKKMMALYKEEGINPLNPGCLPMLIQIPVFIAFYVVLNKAIELRGASTFLIPWVSDLSQPEVIFALPFTIPMYGQNFALLPILNAIVTFFQNKATIKDPNQKFMIYFLPIFLLVLFNSFPAGLTLYWTFQGLLQLGQQYLITHRKKVSS